MLAAIECMTGGSRKISGSFGTILMSVGFGKKLAASIGTSIETVTWSVARCKRCGGMVID